MGTLPAMAGTLTELTTWECDGFRVESQQGPLGVVEEVWRGVDGQPAALALRLSSGGRGLLVAEEVAAVLEADETVVAAPRARLLELGAPHLEHVAAAGGRPRLVASWSTTGVVLPQPQHRALPWLGRRFERSTPRAGVQLERPIWKTVLFLYGGIAVLAALVMTVAFVVAWLVAGRAY